MSLIVTPKHTQHDLDTWNRLARYDHTLASTSRVQTLAEKAVDAMAEFASQGQCCIGFSGGKDSTVVVGLAAEAGLNIPVWRMIMDRPDVTENPEVDLVRDALLARYPDLDYNEFVANTKDGLGQMNRQTGDRYISGVRGSESSNRKLAMSVYGIATERTCRPIGYWKAMDVWTYLSYEDLPIHPAYAYSFDGQLSRDRIRVHLLGGVCSDSMRMWEEKYYPQEMELCRI